MARSEPLDATCEQDRSPGASRSDEGFDRPRRNPAPPGDGESPIQPCHSTTWATPSLVSGLLSPAASPDGGLCHDQDDHLTRQGSGGMPLERDRVTEMPYLEGRSESSTLDRKVGPIERSKKRSRCSDEEAEGQGSFSPTKDPGPLERGNHRVRRIRRKMNHNGISCSSDRPPSKSYSPCATGTGLQCAVPTTPKRETDTISEDSKCSKVPEFVLPLHFSPTPSSTPPPLPSRFVTNEAVAAAVLHMIWTENKENVDPDAVTPSKGIKKRSNSAPCSPCHRSDFGPGYDQPRREPDPKRDLICASSTVSSPASSPGPLRRMSTRSRSREALLTEEPVAAVFKSPQPVRSGAFGKSMATSLAESKDDQHAALKSRAPPSSALPLVHPRTRRRRSILAEMRGTSNLPEACDALQQLTRAPEKGLRSLSASQDRAASSSASSSDIAPPPRRAHRSTPVRMSLRLAGKAPSVPDSMANPVPKKSRQSVTSSFRNRHARASTLQSGHNSQDSRSSRRSTGTAGAPCISLGGPLVLDDADDRDVDKDEIIITSCWPPRRTSAPGKMMSAAAVPPIINGANGAPDSLNSAIKAAPGESVNVDAQGNNENDHLNCRHLSNLNEPQKKAVTCDHDAILVFAGPGKTRVITARVAELVLRQSVHPDHILVVTFTNKAANEMKSRIIKLIGEARAKRLMMGTFHSLMARFLRANGRKIKLDTRFTIIDADDSEKYITRIIRDLVEAGEIPKQKMDKRSIDDIIRNVRNAKCKNLGPEEWVNMMLAKGTGYQEKIRISGRVYREYQAALAKDNCLDFDDLLSRGLELLRALPDLSRRMHYVLVDEYQDTNTVQYELTLEMCATHKRLMIVGDPDQSIYSWREADVTNLKKVQKGFPSSLIINLDQNYRSTTAILESARLVISQDKKREDRYLFTDNRHGHPVYANGFTTAEDEAGFIAKEVRRLAQECQGALEFGHFAVLVRTGAQTRAIEEAFLRARIPHKIVGGMRFYDRAEIKDLISYLRIAENPSDHTAFERAVNVPPRKIGDTSLKRIKMAANSANITYFELAERLAKGERVTEVAGVSKSIEGFVRVVRRLQEMGSDGISTVEDMLNYLIDTLKFEDYLKHKMDKENQKKNKESARSRMDNVKELITIAVSFNQAYDRTAQEGSMIQTFLNNTSLASSVDVEFHSQVTVCTLHTSKGLEWPVVFIAGVDDRKMPLEYCQKPEEIAEERRLLYVGMTRSELLLYLTWPTLRPRVWDNGDPSTKPSPFLKCLEKAKEKKSGKKLTTMTSPKITQEDMESLCRLTKRPILNLSTDENANPEEEKLPPISSSLDRKRNVDDLLPPLVTLSGKKRKANLQVVPASANTGFVSATSLLRTKTGNTARGRGQGGRGRGKARPRFNNEFVS